jgi:hypothetical protein
LQILGILFETRGNVTWASSSSSNM